MTSIISKSPLKQRASVESKEDRLPCYNVGVEEVEVPVLELNKIKAVKTIDVICFPQTVNRTTRVEISDSGNFSHSRTPETL